MSCWQFRRRSRTAVAERGPERGIRLDITEMMMTEHKVSRTRKWRIHLNNFLFGETPHQVDLCSCDTCVFYRLRGQRARRGHHPSAALIQSLKERTAGIAGPLIQGPGRASLNLRRMARPAPEMEAVAFKQSFSTQQLPNAGSTSRNSTFDSVLVWKNHLVGAPASPSRRPQEAVKGLSQGQDKPCVLGN